MQITRQTSKKRTKFSQGRSQEFDLGGYKWVRLISGGGIYTDIPPRRYAPEFS